jgi:PAS domain S-box-containing protein
MKDQSLRVLMVEDSEDDAFLTIRVLKKGGYNPVYERVETAAAMKKALKEKQWDIILCEYKLPKFNAPLAIAVLKEANIDIPLIIVTGKIGEETAAECMRLGAQDYIMKDNKSRLCPAIARELEDTKVRNKEKQAEEALRNNEIKYRTLFESAGDAIFLVDNNIFIDCNRKTLEMFGCTREQIIGQTPYQFSPKVQPDGRNSTEKALEKINAAIKGQPQFFEWKHCRYDGTLFDAEIILNSLTDKDKKYYIQGIVHDITERKKSEEKLLEIEERYKSLFDRSLNLIYTMDFNGRFIDANDAALNLFGYKREEIRSLNVASLMDEDQLPLALKIIQEIMETGTQKDLIEFRLRRKDGSDIYVDTQGSAVISNGKPIAIQAVARDVTDRKRAEKKLRESENRLRAQYNGNPIPTFTWQKQGDEFILTDFNDSAKSFANGQRNSFLGRQASEMYKSRQEILGNIQRCFDEKRIIRIESQSEHFMPGRFVVITFVFVPPDLVMVHMEDITERKQAAEELRESEERYRIIAENTADTIAIFDLNFNPTYISPSILKLRGYPVQEAMALTLDQTLTPDSLQQASKMFADQMALESSGTADPARTTLIDLEEYCKDGSTIWVELAASFLRDNNFKPTGMLTVTRNITERKRAEAKLQQTLESLKNAVGATIQVMVSAVEMRDPYTAGHQHRSADLARAIATEMGLPQDKIDGIRMASSIHDIGKLSIPAEILTKPTKLTSIEFSLIKEHSRIGYEMLKDVESPWPLAQIVYQHHERMDGSGYPRNLKGDEILMEARIMAVADVVEAMASHRPYRPGLGIDAALAEIEKNKGIFYDNTVANACLKLFREKGYQLK